MAALPPAAAAAGPGPGPAVAGEGGGGVKTLKVGAASNPKIVGGAVAHITRAGVRPVVLATGSFAINQAVKSVAIARGYVAPEGLLLACVPMFRADKRVGLELHVVVSRGPVGVPAPEAAPPAADGSEFRVAKDGNPNRIAGAIANKVRDGQPVTVLAIGARSVTAAVQAVAAARKFLEGDGVDLAFRPEFVSIEIDAGSRACSALRLVVEVVPANSQPGPVSVPRAPGELPAAPAAAPPPEDAAGHRA